MTDEPPPGGGDEYEPPQLSRELSEWEEWAQDDYIQRAKDFNNAKD